MFLSGRDNRTAHRCGTNPANVPSNAARSRVSHSQIIATRQPAAVSFSWATRSRLTFASNLSAQKAACVLGIVALEQP